MDGLIVSSTGSNWKRKKTSPFHPQFNSIRLQIMRLSPKHQRWSFVPSINSNFHPLMRMAGCVDYEFCRMPPVLYNFIHFHNSAVWLPFLFYISINFFKKRKKWNFKAFMNIQIRNGWNWTVKWIDVVDWCSIPWNWFNWLLTELLFSDIRWRAIPLGFFLSLPWRNVDFGLGLNRIQSIFFFFKWLVVR